MSAAPASRRWAKPPVIRAARQRFGCNMILAITNKGVLSFMVFQGKFKPGVFVEFLRRLLRQNEGRIYLIVDRRPVHRSGEVQRFVQEHKEWLRLLRMPGYCPELNPDESPNQDVKTNGLGKNRPTNRGTLMGSVRRHLYRRQKQPLVIRNFFHEQHVRYAA